MLLSTAHEVMADASAFVDILGAQLTAPATFGDRTLSFKIVQLPALKVPSGQITASDGYILDAEPFALVVPVGEYPLQLAIAVIGTDERVAFAKLQFANMPVARWEMATRPGQDPKTLKSNEIFGYGVDSGTGCFGDSEAYKLVSEAGSDLADKMMAESQKVYQHTRDWLSIETAVGSMAVFSSGYGDGFYASYFGYSATGDLVALLTDFGLAKWAAVSDVA